MARYLKRRRKLCEYGCGEYVKSRNRFINHHNNRVFSEETKKKMSDKKLGIPTWNKGLTKETDSRMAVAAENMRGISKQAWNKGLTKDDSRVKKYADKLKGRKIPEEICKKVRKSLIVYYKDNSSWCKGLTKETSPILAKRGRAFSKKYTGRKNPEHSKRMKEFYKLNPEKHPNAILGKKTKGNGFTHIEKLMKEYLKELQVPAIFNFKVGTKWIDFAIPEKQKGIECDGEFWHQDLEAEEKRDNYLMNKGWDVLHLTSSNIVTDPKGCKDQVMEFLC